jgi:hypothetical protein
MDRVRRLAKKPLTTIEASFWRGRTFADAAVLSWRSVRGNGRQIAESGMRE